MSITDELREWASASLSYKSRYDALIAIADRIDAEHERLERMRAIEAIASIAIYVNDEDLVEEKPDVVQALTWDGEDWYFTSVEGFFNACGWEHYHKPTVEDVLEEFYRKAKADSDANMGDLYETIADYAKFLRLKEAE